MWTIGEGIKVCQELFPLVKPHGYHVALMGSVLRDGKSDNDLDIAFLPYEDENIRVDWRQLEYLIKNTFDAERAIDLAMPDDKDYEPSAMREIWKGQLNGKEIDFFIFFPY
jgi:hypothetical protein